MDIKSTQIKTHDKYDIKDVSDVTVTSYILQLYQ